MKTVGACSPWASQSAAGKLHLAGVAAPSSPTMPACTERQMKGDFFCRFIYSFSFSWSNLICSRPDSLRICAGSSEPLEESGKDGAWDISVTAMLWVHISTPNTIWHLSHEHLPDGGWSEFHQSLERWGIFLSNSIVHSAVDIPVLHPSFCSQNSSMQWKLPCPGTKACPHLGKESKGCRLHWGLMKCYLEIGEHALILPPRELHLKDLLPIFLQGFAEENL